MKAILIGLGVIVLVAVTVMAARRRRSQAEVVATMRELREMALSSSPAEFDIVPEPGVPWGVVMETGYPEGVASVVAFADGSASLYYSQGGGVMGGGDHAQVNEAARAFVAQTAAELPYFSPAAGHPLPPVGTTRFYLRVDDGLRTAEAPEEELGEGAHPLSALFYAGHELITQIREIAPAGQ